MQEPTCCRAISCGNPERPWIIPSSRWRHERTFRPHRKSHAADQGRGRRAAARGGRAGLALDERPRASAAPAPSDQGDAALRARLAAMQSELTSLRGVQRELLAAKQAAESAMLAKSEFLASMSHEIRTPLNGILPLLDIVLGTDLTPVQREYLVTANASAQELLRIVDDILDYSKAEAGKLDLECVTINIRDLVDSVRRLLLKPAEAKGLTVRAVVDADVRPSVRGDPMRVRQILTNLMSNAIKFT